MNDNNKEGNLRLKITKLSEFARESNGQRLSEPVQVLGIQWRILALSREPNPSMPKYLGCFLQFTGNDSDCWTCTASVTFRLLAQKPGEKDDVSRFECHPFNAKIGGWGYANFMSFHTLMNPQNGWYDEANDAIVLAVHFRAGPPDGVDFANRSDVIWVNEEEVNVNKHHLASSSIYFEHIFFGHNYKKQIKLVIGPPASVAHFRRMLHAMEPRNRPLDDRCIEEILHLAKQFQLTEVESKCREFLAKESKHSAIFKYRLAEEYGFNQLKKQILAQSKKWEFYKQADFHENLVEFRKLDEPACRALDTRLGQLFGGDLEK